MILLNREKRGHFNRLRAASHVEADLALLKAIDSDHTLIKTPSGKDQKYADDVLYALLSLTTDCDIVSFRRKFAKAKVLNAQADLLTKRFAEYVKKSAPDKAVDVEHLIKVISAGLFLIVAPLDLPIGEDIFPSEIDLVSVDNEKFNVVLTVEALASREAAAKLKKEQEAAVLKEKEEEAAKLEKAIQLKEKAVQLKEKEEDLDEKESELSDKESDLEDKEIELSKKEDQLDEKEAELAVKETDLKNKSAVEKKSVSKKKNTPK